MGIKVTAVAFLGSIGKFRRLMERKRATRQWKSVKGRDDHPIGMSHISGACKVPVQTKISERKSIATITAIVGLHLQRYCYNSVLPSTKSNTPPPNSQ